jgi:hypothetical protein
MLARSFKSAEELHLPEHKYAALVEVLGMLERGELKHVSSAGVVFGVMSFKFSGHFNMSFWSGLWTDEEGHCGTVGCLGGSAEMIGNFRFVADDGARGLEALFYPDCLDIAMADVTPAMAAVALRNYLMTGWPRWRDAIRTVRKLERAVAKVSPL